MPCRPVGSGKTALALALCKHLRKQYNIGSSPPSLPCLLLHILTATVTNDIFTREDQEFLIKHRALPPDRILAIETGGCPHAAIREDISANMGALETLQAKFGCQMLFVESGGDNLAANYSRELADYIIYVIDVSVCRFYSRRRVYGQELRMLCRAVTRYLGREVQAYPNQIS